MSMQDSGASSTDSSNLLLDVTAGTSSNSKTASQEMTALTVEITSAGMNSHRLHSICL